MKKLISPTNYFFEQAESIPPQLNSQINQFANGLLNLSQCLLCQIEYNTNSRIPRILVHCGHTFCTPCLVQFYTKNRVRCPMCLKLVKKLDSLQRLPINHTIFIHLMQKSLQKEGKQTKQGIYKQASKFLYGEFQRAQKQAHLSQHPQKYDNQSGLPFCVFHQDRVEHFYCQTHNSFGCRVCIQIGHQKPDCKVADLYLAQNLNKYKNMINKIREQQAIPSGCFMPFPKYGKFIVNTNLQFNGDDQDLKRQIQ